MKTIDNTQFINKKVLVRVDFNVPLDKETFEVADDTRIRAAIPTIKKIMDDGGSVILMSHLGRPKGAYEEKYSLKHVVGRLSELLDAPVKFANDCIGAEAEKVVNSLKPGEVALLENLRFHKEEEQGDENFSGRLARIADAYVNDAFGTAHRAHASTTVIAGFFPKDKYFGYLMASELKNINKVLNQAEKPFVAILGGAKVSDKILIIEQLMKKADVLIIGGGMAYTFLKAQGKSIGNSLCENEKLDVARRIMQLARENNVELLLPVDSVTADKFSDDAAREETKDENIKEDRMGLDIGPKTIKKYSEAILKAKTILWNGPMGVFEFDNFAEGTRAIGQAVAKATATGAYSLVGGGDSVAAVNKYRLTNQVSYVSTGGGALLEYMEGKILPGVAAILN